MAGINVAQRGTAGKEVFVKTIAREVSSIKRYSAAECLEIAERVLFLIANPHLNPLRAKAVAAGLL